MSGAARRAILLVDHGSRRAAANETLRCMADLLRYLVRGELVVQHAHMELASPSVRQGFDACVAAGACEVLVQPYLLARGRHASVDIPRLVGEAAAAHAGVSFSVREPLGVHPKLAEVVLERCGVASAPGISVRDSDGACTLDPEACSAPWCRSA